MTAISIFDKVTTMSMTFDKFGDFYIRAPGQPPADKPKKPSQADQEAAAARRRIEEINEQKALKAMFSY